jgi:hypothetical protein
MPRFSLTSDNNPCIGPQRGAQRAGEWGPWTPLLIEKNRAIDGLTGVDPGRKVREIEVSCHGHVATFVRALGARGLASEA